MRRTTWRRILAAGSLVVSLGVGTAATAAAMNEVPPRSLVPAQVDDGTSDSDAVTVDESDAGIVEDGTSGGATPPGGAGGRTGRTAPGTRSCGDR